MNQQEAGEIYPRMASGLMGGTKVWPNMLAKGVVLGGSIARQKGAVTLISGNRRHRIRRHHFSSVPALSSDRCGRSFRDQGTDIFLQTDGSAGDGYDARLQKRTADQFEVPARGQDIRAKQDPRAFAVFRAAAF